MKKYWIIKKTEEEEYKQTGIRFCAFPSSEEILKDSLKLFEGEKIWIAEEQVNEKI